MTKSPEVTVADALKDVLSTNSARIENPSGRMHFLGVGDLLFPGGCCVCGNGLNPEGFVSIGVYYEGEGQMYLCLTCLTEAAETGGLLSLEQSRVLVDLSTKVSEENLVLRETVKDLSKRVELYESAINAAGAGIVSSPANTDLGVTESPAELVTGPDAGTTEPSESGTSDQPSGTVRPTGSNSGKSSRAGKVNVSKPSNGISL